MKCYDFLARRVEQQSGYQRKLHFHDSNEILFTLNDNCSFFLDGKVFSISRGALMLIPEGAIHQKINPEDVAPISYSIHYPVSFLDAYSTPGTNLKQIYGSRAACVQIQEEQIARMTELFHKCTLYEENTFGSDIRRNVLLLEIFLDLYPLITDDMAGNTKSDLSPLISDVIGYINEHLSERLVLDKLAELFFISKYNLCRQFKKETGFTIIQYINNCRISMACSLLRAESGVKDIGNRVGFANTSHFINVFRKETGVTPRVYQKHYKDSADVPFFHNFAPQHEK